MMPPPPNLRGEVIGLHHVAIAVRKIADARAFYVESLGLKALGDPEFIANQAVNVLVLEAAGQRIELVEPASEQSPVFKFVAKREGLHHLAWQVKDLDATLANLSQAGLRLIDAASRPGAHGTRIAFIHPAACGGVLTELVEIPSGT